jgi:hypothetical protein
VWAAVLLAASTLAAQPAPRLVIDAPAELESAAIRVREAVGGDFTFALLMTGQVGFREPIRVLLVPDDAPLALRTPVWISGYARGSDRLVVLFPDRVPSYPDRSLEALVRHEIAHVMVDEAAGHRSLPRWFHEGVATVAANEWGIEDRARYALAVVGRAERSADDLDRAFAAGGRRAARAYALSSAFVRDLQRRHGVDVTARVLAEVRAGHPFRPAYRRATGEGLEFAELMFFGKRAFWTTWVPFLTSSVALWMGITVLALWAFRRRRLRRAELYERWEAEEVGPTGGPSGAGGPVN